MHTFKLVAKSKSLLVEPVAVGETCNRQKKCVVLHTALPQVLARLRRVMLVYFAVSSIAQVVVIYSAGNMAQVQLFLAGEKEFQRPFSMQYSPLK